MLDELAALVFPAACPGCGRAGEPVCSRCASSLRPAPVVPAPAGVDDWVVAFAYEGVARELVARAKYRNARAGLDWMARVLATVAAGLPGRGPERVVAWVPTTSARRRDRGFDHARILAGGVARGLGLPVAGLLLRGPGPPQTGRSRAERSRGPDLRASRLVVPLSVLLVDDVSTTGATLAAAARAVRCAGARHVQAAVVGRTL